jgi:hypothetical protein
MVGRLVRLGQVRCIPDLRLTQPHIQGVPAALGATMLFVYLSLVTLFRVW